MMIILAPLNSILPYQNETKYWAGTLGGKVKLFDFKSHTEIEAIEADLYSN